MCYLKIPKDCLVRQYKETAFGYGGTYCPNIEHYVFRVPGMELDGYTFTVTSEFGRFGEINALGDWYSVHVTSDDLPITVKRTENREDGKRYKQYKYTPNELCALYGNSYKYAVALISVYANDGTRRAKEILETKYAVGLVDGCWFISDELKQRRRIDTKGVNIRGYISSSDTQIVKDIIEQHKEKEQKTYRQIHEIQNKRRKLEHINELVYKAEMSELKDICEITATAEKALTAHIDELKRELEKLDMEFQVSLEKYYKLAA